MSYKFGIIGGGSWATALVKILQENNQHINWWMRSVDQTHHISKHNKNPKYLSSVSIKPSNLLLTDNIKELIDSSDVLIIATPSAFIHEIFKKIENKDLVNKLIISAVKGIIPQTNQLPAIYFRDQFKIKLEKLLIISGPCHAEEVAMEKLSFLTVACTDLDQANKIADIIKSRYIKATVSDDLQGVELSSVLKNVYAVAAGICSGLGYGDNYIAVLISNCIRELEFIVNNIYPNSNNIVDTAYLGDLLVTAYSQHSRNRRFGVMIGKGYSVKASQMEMKMVAEGYYATKCIEVLNNKHSINAPIAKAMYHILYEKIAPKVEIKILSDLMR